MVSQTFPPNDPKGLEDSVFRELLREALLEYLGLLSNSERYTYNRSVFRPHEKGTFTQVVDFPSYSFARASNATSSPKLKQLLNYIWDRGERRITRRASGQPRPGWESFVVSDVIHEPLAHMLEEVAIDEAFDTDQITFLNLPDVALEKSLDELVRRFCHGEHRYIAKCPIGYVEGEPGMAWQLAEGCAQFATAM